MAENLTIARPYAKAIFEQADADHCLEEWQHILQVLAQLALDVRIRVLFGNPAVGDPQMQTLFEQIVNQALPSLNAARRKELQHFLAILIAEKRLAVLPEILDRYQQLLTAQRGQKEVTVTSAHALDAGRRASMTDTLVKYLRSKVTVDFREDPSLIGGAVIRSGNWVLDGSIKGKLQRLRDGLQD